MAIENETPEGCAARSAERGCGAPRAVKGRPLDLPPSTRFEHGTRARYVTGCRCADCKAANVAAYHARMRKLRELAPTVAPSGPAIEGALVRSGRMFKVRRCPGANGEQCVRDGTWLRGQHQVCGACVDRATVWNGLVSPRRARDHLLALRAAGVGYKAVAAACDVASSGLSRILASDEPIRAQTERRILAVDAGALADHAVVDASEMNAQIADLRARGFTLRHLGRLLGYENKSVLQLGTRPQALAATVARVQRLVAQVERGEHVPERATVDAAAERAWLDDLMSRGVTARWLSKRLGFVVVHGGSARMHPQNVETVRHFRAELEQLLREGTGLPDDWQWPESSSLRFSKGFGFDGGWLIRGRLKLPARTTGARRG